ncbi:MAG: putative lipid II flippase FtsW [Oscillospiraceae bacterium]|nr:putative lipid II flippase FtsW [Oscillospiraceae bacterium]
MQKLQTARSSAASKPKYRLVQKGKMDITFFALLIIILTIGLIMLFSSSYAYAYTYYGDSYKFIKKQFVLAVVGIILMMITSKIDYHQYRKFAWVIYAVAVVLLVVLLILPPMISGVEYKRWFILGPINFQPSEVAKFAIVLLFAHLISLNYKNMEKFSFGVLFLGGLLGVVCLLVVLEPHLSATLLVFSIGIVMMIVGGIKRRYILTGIIGGICIGAIAILSGVVSYGSSRIQNWLNPWLDPKGDGYQTIQSLLSIGSGGFLGRGLGQSRQKYLWVPEPHNDFIFAIVCEELGYIGAMLIILLFCLLVWRGFVIAMRAPDKFGSLLVLGLTFQVGIQAALNILVVTNTIPNTGISLPFFSYGGTSLMILLAEMGIVLSVSRCSTLQKP